MQTLLQAKMIYKNPVDGDKESPKDVILLEIDPVNRIILLMYKDAALGIVAFDDVTIFPDIKVTALTLPGGGRIAH